MYPQQVLAEDVDAQCNEWRLGGTWVWQLGPDNWLVGVPEDWHYYRVMEDGQWVHLKAETWQSLIVEMGWG